MASFRLNRSLERDVARSAEVRALLHRKAQAIASEATRTGQAVASSYQAEVAETAEGVQVQANTGGINAAGWIEFGTSKLSVQAPLRKAAESVGLHLRAR